MRIKKYLPIIVLLLICLSCLEQPEEEELTKKKKPPTSTPSTPTTPNTVFRVMFVSDTALNGSGGVGANFGAGIDDFDYHCSLDALTHSLSGEFKAFLADTTDRSPCSSANCSGGSSENNNWILEPDMEYRRTDKTTVITTTTSSSIFDFPLSNSIDSSGIDVWSGFNNDWTSVRSFTSNCNNFLNINSTSDSYVGTANATDIDMLANGSTTTCDTNNNFYCVEQEPTTVPDGDYKIIFETKNTYQGGSGFMGVDGINDFDGICASEASAFGHVGTYKALVMANNVSGGTERKACYSGSCSSAGANENTNWVLAPNTHYRRSNKVTHIATTNSAGLFEFPLTASLTGNSHTYWTGFSSSFAINNVNSQASACLNWTIKTPGGSALTGIGNSTAAQSINNSSKSCASYNRILCVEQ